MGTAACCRHYDARIPHTVRFVHNEDLVPRVPKFFYDHVGDKCYFDRNKKLLWNPSRYATWIDWMEEINFRSLKVTRSDIRRHPGGIADHSIDRYIACLKKNLPSSAPSSAHSTFLDYINQ